MAENRIATNEQIGSFHSAIKMGLSIEDALLYANITEREYRHWVRCAEIKEEADRLEEEAEKGNAHAYEPPDVVRYRTDKDFRTDVNKSANIIREIRRDRVYLKARLLGDVLKAKDMRSNNWAASKWLLEQIDPQSFQRDGGEASGEQAKVESIKVEYVDPSSKEDQERIKRMEDLIASEAGGIKA